MRPLYRVTAVLLFACAWVVTPATGNAVAHADSCQDVVLVASTSQCEYWQEEEANAWQAWLSLDAALMGAYATYHECAAAARNAGEDPATSCDDEAQFVAIIFWAWEGALAWLFYTMDQVAFHCREEDLGATRALPGRATRLLKERLQF